jgi:hypothetical protein
MAPIDEKKLSLWNTVSKTNPKHTKKVKFGREFTAIDPHSQILEATKQFGAAGTGWGWCVVREAYPPTNDVAILVRLWHGVQECSVEQWGQCSLYIDGKETRKDSDCYKKATTDGLTKCLSYLGFNADVFLGKFDDNKYVQQMEAEFSGKAGTAMSGPRTVQLEPTIPAKEADEQCKIILSDYAAATTTMDLQKAGTKHGTFLRGTLENQFPEMFNTIVIAYKERLSALTSTEGTKT